MPRSSKPPDRCKWGGPKLRGILKFSRSFKEHSTLTMMLTEEQQAMKTFWRTYMIFGSNFRIPRNLFTCHWIRIASIVLCLDLQSLPTHVNELRSKLRSCEPIWANKILECIRNNDYHDDVKRFELWRQWNSTWSRANGGLFAVY